MTIADIVMLTATIIIWSLLIVNILLVIFGYVYYLKTDPYLCCGLSAWIR